MKGFIEVTSPNGKEMAVSLSVIEGFEDGKIYVSDDAFNVKETYSELKALIEEAQAEPKTEPPCVDCDCPYSPSNVITPDYEIVGFTGTKEALDRLSIRKEEQ